MATPIHTPELSVVPADGEPAATHLAAPFLVLEIRRGRTGYPTRPVCSRNFIIGSGPGSDLRLGGDDIPIAHTVLILHENNVLAQWLGESPALLVNGNPVQETGLCDGDLIGIGRFEFLVHRIQSQPTAEDVDSQPRGEEPTATRRETAELLDLLAEAKADEPPRDLAELSASELVDLLEAEQQSALGFDAGLHQAEAAIMSAAAHQAENLLEESGLQALPLGPELFDGASENSHSEPSDSEILGELEKVIQQLSGFSSELDLRARRIAAEEATQAEAAELLLDAQKELASQLERFHKQVSESHEHPEPRLRKAA